MRHRLHRAHLHRDLDRDCSVMPRGWGSMPAHPGGFRATINIAGKREQKVLPTKPEAKAWLKIMRARKLLIEAGAAAVPGLAEQVRYREIKEQFERRLEIGFKRPPTKATIASYKGELRELLKWWGPRQVSATTERDVQAYVAQLRGDGLSTSTIRHRLDRLSQLMRYAVEQRLIAREPCRISRPSVTLTSQPETVTDEQVAAMAKAARGNALAVVLLAADAGLRRDEIRRLRPEDVRLDHVHVAVRGEADRTKSGKGRDVPILTKRLGLSLQRANFKTWPRSAWSVATAATGPWNAAGLPGRARLHALRHRFVTSLLAAGVRLAHVQGWAGHSTPAVTMRYAHLDPLDVPAAAFKALSGHGRGTMVPRGTAEKSGKVR